MKKLRLFLLGLITVALVIVFWQRERIGHLQKDNLSLRAIAADIEQLRSENARLSKTEMDSVELARLREDHSELLRLRGETSRLRQQLKAQAAIPKPREQSTSPAVASPVEISIANVEAELSPRQTLVTGGWPTPDGRRTFLLIEPTLIDETGKEITVEQAREKAGTAQIDLQTRFVEVPEELLQSLGLKNVVSDGNQSSAQLTLTKDQSELLLKNLTNGAGIDTLSAPRITTANGRQAQVSVTDERTIDNQKYQFGPKVEVVPQISPDGSSIKLTVDASITRETPRK